MPLLIQLILQVEAYHQQMAGQGGGSGPFPTRTAQRGHGFLLKAPQELAPKSALASWPEAGHDSDTLMQRLLYIGQLHSGREGLQGREEGMRSRQPKGGGG